MSYQTSTLPTDFNWGNEAYLGGITPKCSANDGFLPWLPKRLVKDPKKVGA